MSLLDVAPEPLSACVQLGGEAGPPGCVQAALLNHVKVDDGVSTHSCAERLQVALWRDRPGCGVQACLAGWPGPAQEQVGVYVGAMWAHEFVEVLPHLGIPAAAANSSTGNTAPFLVGRCGAGAAGQAHRKPDGLPPRLVLPVWVEPYNASMHEDKDQPSWPQSAGGL